MLREKIKSKQGFGSIIGRAPEMEKLYRIIAKAAHSVHPVLIQGESGTGKEMVARAIHYSGPFRDKPFIPVDCGSLVPTLIESELFGYVKGAFTGAVQAKEGCWRLPMGERFFSMKSASFRWICRQRCCGASGEGDSPGRQHEADRHQRANSGGDESGSGNCGGAGFVPARPILSFECVSLTNPAIA